MPQCLAFKLRLRQINVRAISSSRNIGWCNQSSSQNSLTFVAIVADVGNTETANKDGIWLREISSCCCLTTAGKTRQLLLNKIYIPFLPSLYRAKKKSLQILLSSPQAGPGRKVKQEQEEISRNHVPRLFLSSVYLCPASKYSRSGHYFHISFIRWGYL